MKDSVIIPLSIAENVLSEKKRLSKIEAYIYLLLKVNGETTSFGKLADAWKWPTSATVSRYLSQLKDAGLIDIEVSKTGTKITLNDTPNDTHKDTPKPAKTKGKRKVDDTPNDTPNDTPKQTDLFGEEPVDERTAALNRKFKELNYDIDFSFVEPHLEDAFFRWLKYKQGRREKYKNQKSLKQCYDKMKKDCKGSSLIAMQMIDQSEANNYAGLFPLKTNNSNTPVGFILNDNDPDRAAKYSDW